MAGAVIRVEQEAAVVLDDEVGLAGEAEAAGDDEVVGVGLQVLLGTKL